MAPSRTSTVKSKHASNKSGIRNSKTSSSKPQPDGIVKPKSAKSKRTQSKGVSFKQQRKVRTGNGDLQGKGSDEKGSLEARLKKKGRRVYTEKELGIPTLNMITPVGVQKPKGGKKGKVFVDDRESMMTILAMVNADKEGQIESKMMKARQMEEIREARKAEAEKKVEDRKQRLDETKEGMRKKRKRSTGAAGGGGASVDGGEATSRIAATKPLKKRKSVSFA